MTAPRRFWREVTVADGAIRLDDGPLRTPARAELRVPTPALAEAIAEEWRAVEGAVDPRAMPLTGLANAAIDRVAPDPAAFACRLTAYAESDLTCYRADAPAPLVARQTALWDPPLDWASGRYGAEFLVVTGIVHIAQPPETVARMAAATAALPPFLLAALSPLVTLSGSLVLGLALVEGAIGREAAWAAAELDELWQAEQWGEDELAAAARADRHRDFAAAARFAGLL